MTLVHLSLLSVFASRVDLSAIAMSARCLLAYHHPYMVWWLYVKNIHSLRRFSTLVRIGGGGYRVLAKLSHTRSRHFEWVLAMYTKPRGHNDYPLELWLGRVSFRFLIFEVSLSPSFLKRWNLRIERWLLMNYFQQKESGTSLSGLCSGTGWRIGFGTSIGTGVSRIHPMFP